MKDNIKTDNENIIAKKDTAHYFLSKLISKLTIPRLTGMSKSTRYR